MSDASARFGLPWLQPGQAQKEMFHNEALAMIDAALHPVVQAIDAVTPPATPLPGQGWALGGAPTGAWAGRGGQLACWTDGGWRFLPAPVGMTVWHAAAGLPARRTETGWSLGVVVAGRIEVAGKQVVASRRAAIADPAPGGSEDANARAAISAILQALRGHGLIDT